MSAGGPPPPSDAPGLTLVAFELGSGEAVSAVAEAAGETSGAGGDSGSAELLLSDPDGEALSFAAARRA